MFEGWFGQIVNWWPAPPSIPPPPFTHQTVFNKGVPGEGGREGGGGEGGGSFIRN